MLQTTVKDTTKTEYIAIYCRTATYALLCRLRFTFIPFKGSYRQPRTGTILLQ